jgi:hypothetical protein
VEEDDEEDSNTFFDEMKTHQMLYGIREQLHCYA